MSKNIATLQNNKQTNKQPCFAEEVIFSLGGKNTHMFLVLVFNFNTTLYPFEISVGNRDNLVVLHYLHIC